MDARPRDLAARMAEAAEQLITLPLPAARRKAREIIDQPSNDGLLAVVGNCGSLPMVRLCLPFDTL
jgi:hypothetical protein